LRNSWVPLPMKVQADFIRQRQHRIRTRYRTLNSTLTWLPWPLVTSTPSESLIGCLTSLV
jgi:hypothetical protein